MNNLCENGLFHSNPALSVTHEFYDKQYLIYVEGDDDIPFWDAIFSKVAAGKYEMESLNGITGEMKSRIRDVKNGEITNVIIACDKDYSSYLEEDPYDSPFIVTTYGHSIENTMFCPRNIAIYLKRLSKSTVDYMDVVNDWYNDFCYRASKLLPYEIANYINTKNGSTEEMPSFFGKNCCMFLDDLDKSKLDEDKIEKHIESYKYKYDPEYLSEIEYKIKEDVRDRRFLIKGHFITNGVMNLIFKETQKVGRETKIERKQLYATFCDCITSCKELCKDKRTLIERIRNIFE